MIEHDGPVAAGSRLIRLLSMLSYLAGVGEAGIAELAERFEMTQADVVAELELASCCGVAPYTPDQLLELIVDSDRVYAFGLDVLRRPPRLTPDEGFAVAAAARALLSVDGADPRGPLAGALTKLERALGKTGVQVELDASPFLAELRRRAAEATVIEIDYLGAKRGDETTRTVEPFAVVAREGRFYLDAYCRLAGDWRRFALDRITRIKAIEEVVEARTMPSELSGTRAFVGGGSRLCTIELSPGAAVFIERFAIGKRAIRSKNRVRVDIEVSDEHWLGKLLLRVGPDAEVISPPELTHAPEKVARRALFRYQEENGKS